MVRLGAIVTAVVLTACAETNQTISTPLSSASSQTPLLQKVAGKTYVLRGSPNLGGRQAEYHEWRISFIEGGSVRYAYFINHSYWFSECRGYSSGNAVEENGRITVTNQARTDQCKERWEFTLSDDGSRLVAQDGSTFEGAIFKRE
jgi:hypothetical protein